MKRWIKRILAAALVGLLLILIIGGILFILVGRSGSGRIEQWIGGQIMGIAAGYLNPRLSFEKLDYEYPATVRLRNLRLTAPDPRSPTGEVEIMGAAQVTIVLAEVPSVGKPIVIQSIVADRPLFQVVKIDSELGAFAGFSNLVKSAQHPVAPGQADARPAGEAAEPSPARAEATPSEAEVPASVEASPPAEVGAPPKLSDVFQMRQIELREARIVYDPRIEGTVPMELDKIDVHLNFEPDDRGWYAVKTALARKPIFDAQISGKLNLDSLHTEDLDFKLDGQLADEQINYLPPELQRLIEQYRIRGELHATVKGRMPMTNPAAGELQAQLSLVDGHFITANYEVPVESVEVIASMANGRAVLEHLSMLALNGEAVAQGFINFSDESLPARLEATAKNLVLAGMQREGAGGAAPKPAESTLRGRLRGDLAVEVPLRSLLAALEAEAPAETVPPPEAETAAARVPPPLPRFWGRGQVGLDQARLVHLPIVSNLLDAIKGDLGEAREHVYDERASIDFVADGGLVRVEKFVYIGPAVAARGEGVVYLDGQLNLEVKAGMVEKMQSMLGPELGRVTSALTDQFVIYHVTGSIGDPHVRLHLVRGLDRVPGMATAREGVGDAGRAVGRGVRGIGGGLRGALDRDRRPTPTSRPATEPAGD